MKNIFCIVVISILISGCGTIVREDIKHDTNMPYPATTLDGGLIIASFSPTPPGSGEGFNWYDGSLLMRTVIFGCSIIDLPISLVVDTILLPYDIFTLYIY